MRGRGGEGRGGEGRGREGRGGREGGREGGRQGSDKQRGGWWGSLTNIAQYDWQQYKSMQCPPDQHAHVHSEIVDLKQLRFGEQ